MVRNLGNPFPMIRKKRGNLKAERTADKGRDKPLTSML